MEVARLEPIAHSGFHEAKRVIGLSQTQALLTCWAAQSYGPEKLATPSTVVSRA